MYLTATRPNLVYVVCLISRFMESPKDSHSKFGKQIMRYVAWTLGYGLWYTHAPNSTLTGYNDNDFVGSIDDRKITSSYVFHLGTNLISWESKKQPIVSMSSTEAEYVATTTTSCHTVCIRRILKDMGHTENKIQILFFVTVALQ